MSTVITSQELKGFQSQLAKAQADMQVAFSAMTAAQRDHSAAQNRVKQLEAKIRELQESSAEPIVSEHAMLRWLERANGLSLDAIREVILGDGTADMIKFMKNGKLKKDGFTLIVKNNTVVTVE
ncbi:MAG TPA: hypothetical protein VJ654_14175 [Noviherbaspirillum sp.]|nr:hypothetical protein [Noviherbaspirillum sp.]